ncbi:hypothetical protein ACLB2K_020271 [Fragaria x ananassa]
MLGNLGSSSDATTATATAVEPFGAHEGGGGDGGVGSNSGEEEKNSYSRGGDEFGDRSFGGNRWPRQETLALLKIRSDMDVAFRDASVKGPLWDEVSRKLAELGFHRSAKKCKEKFENVYKYHRRTKEGRTGKSEGKTYRFFDQLQALENQPPIPTTPNSTTTHQPRPQPTIAMAVSNPPPLPTISHINSTSTNSTNTVPSAAPHQGIATPTIPISLFPPTNPIIFTPPPQPPPQQNPTSHHQHHQATTFVPPSTFPSISSTDLMSNSTSSSTSSDEEMEGRAKRKRKWKDFFETLMKQVVHKQEDLQKRFLEAIEKREHERMAREEAWRMQEMARINREREILAQERSIAAAKDSAVMSFLQKIAEQQHNPQATPTITPNNHLVTSQQPQPQPPPAQQPAPPPQRQQTTPPPLALQITQAPITSFEITPRANGETNNDNNNMVNATTSPSSSRWPRVEVHSLIKLRTGLDSKYQENGPKGPLWEEISAGMKKLGYNRSAKRCKEKWENINKYFKKVKESNKKRPEDSKTCPYFHLLDSLYKERNNKYFDQMGNNNNNNNDNNNSPKPENNAAPMMVRPEQQWQPPRVEPERDQNHEEEERDGDEDDEEDEGNYEIVANNGASVSVGASATAEATGSGKWVVE